MANRDLTRSLVGVLVTCAVGSAAHVEAGESTRLIPQTYEECKQAGPLAREVSALRCVYTLEPEPTERFTACLLQAETYQQWREQSCRWLPNQVVHGSGYGLRCGNTLVGVFGGPCELIYYNPSYEFPQDYGTCKARDGQLDQTYLAEPLCTAELDLPPYYGAPNKTVFTLEIGRRLMDACRTQGGNYALALGKYPECRKTFEIQTPSACEALSGQWQEVLSGRFGCVIRPP